jgi:hypothetical protein
MQHCGMGDELERIKWRQSLPQIWLQNFTQLSNWEHRICVSISIKKPKQITHISNANVLPLFTWAIMMFLQRDNYRQLMNSGSGCSCSTSSSCIIGKSDSILQVFKSVLQTCSQPDFNMCYKWIPETINDNGCSLWVMAKGIINVGIQIHTFP